MKPVPHTTLKQVSPLPGEAWKSGLFQSLQNDGSIIQSIDKITSYRLIDEMIDTSDEFVDIIDHRNEGVR